MSDKPDVAALTDEQRDEIIRTVRENVYSRHGSRDEHFVAVFNAGFSAGRASLPVPADVAALIARLRRGDRFTSHRDLRIEAAAALQSQAEKIAELDRGFEVARKAMHTRAETAEARVKDLEGRPVILSEWEQLVAERDALRKDAERYRWLRNPDIDIGPIAKGWQPDATAGFNYLDTIKSGSELDDAIDAARAKD